MQDVAVACHQHLLIPVGLFVIENVTNGTPLQDASGLVTVPEYHNQQGGMLRVPSDRRGYGGILMGP